LVVGARGASPEQLWMDAEEGGTTADETKRVGATARSPMRNALKTMVRGEEKGQVRRNVYVSGGDG